MDPEANTARPPVKVAQQRDGQGKVYAVTNATEAEKWVPVWQDLLTRSVDHNVFYAPMFILPAFKHLPQTEDAQILFVHAPVDADRLIGVFILQKKRQFKGLPVPHFIGWKNSNVFFGAPLVDPDYAADAWDALQNWARQEGGMFLDLSLVPTGRKGLIVEQFERSMLETDPEGADAYLARVGSPKSRKRWRRQMRKLTGMGVLELRKLSSDEAVEPWIEGFLELEAKGWKGEEGTALASNPNDAAFFRSMSKAAHSQHVLHMLAYHLDGVPIAMQCNLIIGRQAFAFKVAFDEAYATYSPGVLLERAAIHDFHGGADGLVVDSCSKEGHALMGRLWLQSRPIERRISPVGGPLSALVYAAICLLSKLRHPIAQLRKAGR